MKFKKRNGLRILQTKYKLTNSLEELIELAKNEKNKEMVE